MRKINKIFIHCSAGHGDLASVERWWFTPKPNGMGWMTGGYHFWVDYDGTITQLYSVDEITNGVGGHNKESIHICYRGGVEKGNVKVSKDTRTPDQEAGILLAIREIFHQLKPHQSLQGIQILGHRDISPDKNLNGKLDPNERIKDCPSFDAKEEYSWITQQVNE